MSVVLTIIALLLVFDALWWWRADRLLRPVRRAPRWRSLLALFMTSQLVCLIWAILGRFTGAEPRGDIYAAVIGATFIWHMLVLLPVMVLWMGTGITAGCLRLMRSITQPRATVGSSNRAASEDEQDTVGQANRGTKGITEPSLPLSTRRQFLGGAVAAVPPLVTVIGSGIATAQLDEFRIRRIDLTIPDLPRDLEGLRIAQVSDVHVGAFTHGPLLRRIADATNALRPDLVLLPGDLINMSLSDLPSAIDMVNRLDPRRGLYLCEGNHDLIESRRAFETRMRQAGLPLLINESADVRVRGYDVQILGLRWGSGRPGASRGAERGDEAIAGSLAELRPQIHPGAFSILLAHHPHAFDPAAEAGIPLTLAGHTHGGQLMLTPAVGFGSWMYRYYSGAYAKNNGRNHLVVSNGVGNWFPLRVNAPAEIVDVNLHRA